MHTPGWCEGQAETVRAHRAQVQHPALPGVLEHVLGRLYSHAYEDHRSRSSAAVLTMMATARVGLVSHADIDLAQTARILARHGSTAIWRVSRTLKVQLFDGSYLPLVIDMWYLHPSPTPLHLRPTPYLVLWINI